MTTSETSFQALRGDLARAKYAEDFSALNKKAESTIYRATNITRPDFDVRHLVVETIRDPFSSRKYNALPPVLRRKLNLTVALLQCIFISGPAFLYMAMPSGSDTSCVYATPERIPMAIVTRPENRSGSGSVSRLAFADTIEYHKAFQGFRETAWTAFESHKDWNERSNRGKEICSLLQQSSLARREDTTRDYLGPFVERTVDDDKHPTCGYWSGPDRSYDGVDQAYWIDAFKTINRTGAHYGRVPQLSRDRPVDGNDMIKDAHTFVHVCIMKPIKVTVFGTERALTMSIVFLIIAYCGVYVLGPASHSNTLFTLSYVGTVNIAGTATMMLSFLINCFAVWGLEQIICYRYRAVLKEATAPENDD